MTAHLPEEMGARVYVGPAFENAGYNEKHSLAELIYHFYFGKSEGDAIVRFMSEPGNAQIGRYTANDGLML